ncbi:MAG: hypothetical protein JW745_05950 [Sedimentisphaerales bacterium]|nr:hypothetical protein [Sedimentisphaerales bacterium]MBN2843142.1 hypothetical protein [Sedimentisphaerales bacterium]
MKKSITILLAFLALVISNGCNTQQGLTNASNNNISVEYCPKAQIIDPQLQITDNTAWLTGTVAQRSDSAGPLLAHIDIKAYSSNSKELFSDNSDCFIIPKKTIGRINDRVTFKTQLSHIPTTNDKIILTIHDSCQISGCPMTK